MPSDLNIVTVINIGARDAGRNAYAVQLWHEGKPLDDDWVQIDRQALLEAEHRFSPREYGMQLYAALFTRKLNRAYQRLIGQAGAEAAIHVQLVIRPDAPELHALPWERLFHVFGDGETPLAASARTPFSRFLVSGVGDQPPVREWPLRMLVAIANPTGLPDGCSPLDVAGEVIGLADLLAGLPGRVRGTLLAGRGGLPDDDLRRRLVEQGWSLHDGVTSWQAIQRHLPGHHVLHILAHGRFKPGDAPGKGTAYLLLEHESADRIARGALDRVADDEIIAGLAGVHPLPQLIFLAACDSAKRPVVTDVTSGANAYVGLAPKLVAAGVPAIVAMQDLVPVDLARTLAADFYNRLFDHGLVDRALNEARSLAYERDQFKWAIPVLFLRLRDGQLFATTPIKPPHSDSVRKGFAALADLMRDPDVRDAAVELRTICELACERLEVVRDYKHLHDLLHDLQLQCYNMLKQEEDHFPDDDRAMGNVMAYRDTLADIISDLKEVAERRAVDTSEYTWLQSVAEARDALAAAIQHKEKKQLKRAIWLLRRVLTAQPARVNASLKEATRATPLRALVQALRRLHDDLAAQNLDPQKLDQFKEGLEALDALDHNLSALVTDHDRWQYLDVELRRIEDTIGQDMLELEMSWPDLISQTEALCSSNGADWATSFREAGDHLNHAIAEGDVAQIKLRFRLYRRQATMRFHKVDKALKRLCDDLRDVGIPLTATMRLVQ